MATDANKAAVRTFWSELGADSYPRLVEGLYHPKAKYHGAGGEDLAGVEDLVDYVGGYFAAFPDMKIEVKAVFGEGEWVASQWQASGTHEAELQGIPATHRHVTVAGATIQRFEDGKVVEEWEFPDLMSLMAQLGVMET